MYTQRLTQLGAQPIVLQSQPAQSVAPTGAPSLPPPSQPVAAAPMDPNLLSVEAVGSGATKLEALNDAWQQAVRSAIGMYMVSKTEIIDDDINEQIVAYSRGRLDSYKEISSNNENGIWAVNIVAFIEKSILEESAEVIRKKSVNISGDAVSQAINVANANESLNTSKIQLITTFLDTYNALDIIQYNISSQEIKNDKLFININTYIDKIILNNYKNQIIELLNQISTKVETKIYDEDTIILNNKFENGTYDLKNDIIRSGTLYKNNEFYIYHSDIIVLPISTSKYNIYYIEDEDINKFIYEYVKKNFDRRNKTGDAFVYTAKLLVEIYNNNKLIDSQLKSINLTAFFDYRSYSQDHNKIAIYPYIGFPHDTKVTNFAIIFEFNIKNFKLDEQNNNLRIDVSLVFE